jgi:hypothetical protein
MKYISHRGNLTEVNPARENSPDYLLEAIAADFDVEVDVWFVDGKIMLGHDAPTYEVDLNFIKNERFWCHAKNAEALEFMLANSVHCFWHENDQRVLTSRGYVWTYPYKQIINNAVVVILDKELDYAYVSRAVAVCGDFVQSWRQ